jgi:3-oxoacyl-[acyl-carrier-protein] synthase-3
MQPNIQIKAIGLYHPENKVSNDVYVEHFKKKGRDVTHFLDIMGKKERFIIDNVNENSLTMAIQASRKALDSLNMKGNEIDMIVFSTQVPEFLTPTNASKVHQAIEGAGHAIVMDSNANCSGMVLAVEQTSRYMMANPHINTALVVGSDHLSLIANPEQEITYGMFGDASCAVILEKTEEDRGFIDGMHHTYTGYIDKIHYPVDGASVSIGKDSGRFIDFQKFDASFGTPIIFNLIESILERNDLQINDINAFCLSQFAYGDTQKIQERFHIPSKKIIYVGDRFGYTGTTSPFVALHEGIQEGKIKRGDTVLFWTVGAGHQFIAMLFKY